MAGSHEISSGGKTEVLGPGSGHWIPARENHSHRYLPQTRVLALQLSERPPQRRAHGADVLYVSENALPFTDGAQHILRVREFTLAPGASLQDRSTSEGAVAYVVEGTMTSRVGSTDEQIAAGKVVEWRSDEPHSILNQGAALARIVLFDVRKGE